MKQTYSSDIAFAHAVRYNDAMIRAWMRRTGRGNSYKPEDLAREAPHIDVPDNDDRGRAESINFVTRPLEYGKPYYAYLSHARAEHWVAKASEFDLKRGIVATWNGEVLAYVTRISSFHSVVFGRRTNDERGTFWAIGIDGRTYYGRHNGRGMHCCMRLAKYQDEYDVQQYTPGSGWETVTSANTRKRAREHMDEYVANAPEFAYRIKATKVKQT